MYTMTCFFYVWRVIGREVSTSEYVCSGRVGLGSSHDRSGCPPSCDRPRPTAGGRSGAPGGTRWTSRVMTRRARRVSRRSIESSSDSRRRRVAAFTRARDDSRANERTNERTNSFFRAMACDKCAGSCACAPDGCACANATTCGACGHKTCGCERCRCPCDSCACQSKN